MKTWNLWDFPENLYILLNPRFREEFFQSMFSQHGGIRPYARFLGLTQKAPKYYWKGYSEKNGRKYNQYVPLWVLKKSCNTQNLKKKVENNIIKIRVEGGNPIENFNLILKESPELYRITAHLIADGFAGETKVPFYSNTCKELREQFKRDLQIFGEVKTYERTPNTTPCVMFQKPIANILRHIFKIEFTRPSNLPKEIFNAPEICKREFLKALYDDEGCISTNLCIDMSNYNIVKQIKFLVESLNVKTTKIMEKKEKNKKPSWSFNIKRKYLRDYKEKIDFNHPEKSKNLDFAIKTQNRRKRTRDMLKIKEQIMVTIKDKPKTTLEIANNIQLTLGYTLKLLTNLEKEYIVKKGGFKNKLYWSLLKA